MTRGTAGRWSAASGPVGCDRCDGVPTRLCCGELRAAIGEETESSPPPAAAGGTGADVSALWDRRVRVPGPVRGALVMPPRWSGWAVTWPGGPPIVEAQAIAATVRRPVEDARRGCRAAVVWPVNWPGRAPSRRPEQECARRGSAQLRPIGHCGHSHDSHPWIDGHQTCEQVIGCESTGMVVAPGRPGGGRGHHRHRSRSRSRRCTAGEEPAGEGDGDDGRRRQASVKHRRQASRS